MRIIVPEGSGRKQAQVSRKSKISKEMITKITNLIKAGNFAKIACQVARISEDTYYRWIKLGKAHLENDGLDEEGNPSLYSEFSESIKEAEAQAEARVVMKIQQAMDETWQAGAWYLERKYPERWAKREQLTIAEGDPLPLYETDPDTEEDTE